MFQPKRLLALFLSLTLATAALPTAALASGEGSLDNFARQKNYIDGVFSDVSAGDWYYENVKTVWELGLMEGTGANTFDPQGSVTIAEALTIAARLHAVYHRGSSEFTPSSPWYQTYADYCTTNGITGSWQGRYAELATRETFASILANALPDTALPLINHVPDNAIPDVAVADSYGAAVYKLYRAGIMTGVDDAGAFSPASAITRGEMAAIVTRMSDASLRKLLSLGSSFTVTFDYGFQGREPETLQAAGGEPLSQPDTPTRGGYIFQGWYTQASGGELFDFTTPVQGNMILYARWKINPLLGLTTGTMYTVTFDANGADDVTDLPEAQKVTYGARVSIPLDPSRDGYTFGGWYRNKLCTTPFDFNSGITSNLTLYAKWTAVE